MNSIHALYGVGTGSTEQELNYKKMYFAEL